MRTKLFVLTALLLAPLVLLHAANPEPRWKPPIVGLVAMGDIRQWRYIRYADGGEELYDETRDPYEWTNLATKPEHAATKASLAKFLPTHEAPHQGDGFVGTTDEDTKKKGKKKKTAVNE